MLPTQCSVSKGFAVKIPRPKGVLSQFEVYLYSLIPRRLNFIYILQMSHIC